MFKALQDSLSSLIYPQQCAVCAGQVDSLADGVACRACWTSTRLFDGCEMLCDKCGAFFGDTAAPVAVYCRKCDDHDYDKAAATGIYEKGLAAAIVELKTVPAIPERLRAVIRDAFLPSVFSEV